MSPTDTEERKPTVKAHGIASKPGRFDPSEPLHMTTRRASKIAATNGSPPMNGSIEVDQSPYGSFDDGRPATSHSRVSHSTAANVSPYGVADPVTTPPHLDHDEPISTVNSVESSQIESFSASQQTPSPSRKRKRYSPSPSSLPNMAAVTATLREQHEMHGSDEDDTVEVAHGSQYSDHDDSDESSETDENPHEDHAIATQSVDVTPEVSTAVSPASSVSGSGDASQEKQLNDVAPDMPTNDAELMDDGDDADEGDDADDHVRSEGGRPFRRRGGKRRRARHQIDDVEIALRRQLEARKAFRAIMRELKPVLAEISQRTLDDLTTNNSSYEAAAEHPEVIGGLDAALKERQSLIHSQHKLDLQLLQERLAAEERVINSKCQLLISDAKDAYLDRIEREMVGIAHDARLQCAEEQYETEDEDDIIPRPKRMAYRWKRGGALDSKFDSRSRLALEISEALDGVGRRFAMQKMLHELEEGHVPNARTTFTVMDRTARDAAIVRREEITHTKTLAEAASEIERIASIPVIRNEEAFGLQLLGDLASRPSIGAPTMPVVKSRLSVDSLVTKTPPRARHLPEEAPPNDRPIHVEMSPRTRAWQERLNNPMPPPSTRTPRQSISAIASPSTSRPGLSVPSPTRYEEHINGLHSIVPRPIDRDQSVETKPSANSAGHPGQEQWPHFQQTRLEERRPDNGQELQAWQAHVHPLAPASDRRARSIDDRPGFDFLRQTPAPIHPASSLPPREPNEPSQPDVRTSMAPWAQYTLHDPPPILGGRPNSAGTREPRPQDPEAWTQKHPGPVAVEPPPSPRFVDSGLMPEAEPHSEGHQLHDPHAPHRSHQDPQRPLKKNWKMNKDERGGDQRRKNKKGDKKLRPNSLGPASLFGESPSVTAPFSHSPVEQAPPTTWHVATPPQSAPQLAPQPPPTMPPSMVPPPLPPHYGPPSQPTPTRHDYGPNNEHRNSYPPHQAPLLPGFRPLPPSPGFAFPQPPRPPPPPPPGVSFDKYHGHTTPLQPPPAPHFQPPLKPTPPQPAPGSYGQQYGPTLAPAPTPDPRYPPPVFGSAPGNQHLPAFAQQRRQDEKNRRRTQSDSPLHPTWRPYHGPSASGSNRR